MALLTVNDALDQILGDVAVADIENVSLHNATARVLARDLKASRNQPPFRSSAMDGYAIRADKCQRAANQAANHRRSRRRLLLPRRAA